MLDHTMAMGIANTLREGQITGWTKSVEILLGLINGVKYDSVTDFVSLPALAGTAVGLRLMMRFSPKLQKACKNSFDGQTLVATEKGLVPIEDIKIGDRVWAYNETNQTKSLQEVTHLIRGEGNKTLTDIKLDSGEVITATANHPFWEVADHNWTEASQLTLNDILFNIQEKNTTISSLKSYSQNAIVYNLTVANDHTYFVGAGGVLGHNSKNCPIGTSYTHQLVNYGTKAWRTAVKSLRNQTSKGSNYRTQTSQEALMLLTEAFGNMNRYKNYTQKAEWGKRLKNRGYLKGYEKHLVNVREIEAGNDLPHIKWFNNKVSGHIFYENP